MWDFTKKLAKSMTKQQSMTAFARAVSQSPERRISVEIKSLNHRFLELNLKLPDNLRHLEAILRERLQEVLKRGKVDIWISQEILHHEDLASINHAAVQYWLEELSPFSTNPDLSKLSWEALLSLPNVLIVEAENSEKNDQDILQVFETALADFVAMREREGAAIIEVLTTCLDKVESQVKALVEHLPVVQEKFRNQLLERLENIKVEVDNGRFEQELALLLAKIDVKEELDRLLFHVEETRKTLQQTGSIGRRVDFLMQEFNREANTLGSKAGDHVLSRAAVDLKVLIEQMREQVQNLA